MHAKSTSNSRFAPYHFIITLLAIEFLDEFIFGGREAAWPLIRTDLGLTYIQIGLLLSLPKLVSNLVEPVLGIFGDFVRPDGRGIRRLLILGGGIVFTFSLLLTAISQNYLILLVSFILFNPASGAFVSLSQAVLMDAEPARREHNMARWTFAGSLGVVAGPFALGAAVLLNLGWRGLFMVFAGLTLLLLGVAWRFPFSAGIQTPGDDLSKSMGFKGGLLNVLRALKRREVLRWLVLLEFSDLMMDVLYGYLALYFVDVVGVSPVQASLAVGVWAVMGLLGDFLLIPLLERVPGLVYLRASTVMELVLFPAFLLAPGMALKLVALGLLGLFNAGWYAILKARLYSAMPGRSGTSMAVNNVSGLVGSIIPLALGWMAQRYNLQVMMWLLLLGPLALFVGIPRSHHKTERA